MGLAMNRFCKANADANVDDALATIDQFEYINRREKPRILFLWCSRINEIEGADNLVVKMTLAAHETMPTRLLSSTGVFSV